MTSVYRRLLESAERYPENDFLVYPGWLARKWSLPREAWTYAQAVAEIDALAARYHEAGYGPGHRVALLFGNRPEHFLHWMALNSLGASMVPLNPDYRPEEQRYVLEHSEAECVVGPEVAASGLPPARRPAPGNGKGEDAECALLYTSGTTGKPKGCLLSNGYFFGFGEWYIGQRGLLQLRPGKERLMQVLPTFHINASANSLMGVIYSGGAQVMLDRFHSSTWWRDAIETRATCFHYLGVIPAMLMNLPPSPDDHAHGMRYGMGGGVHPSHHAAFEARFGAALVEGWTMTEAGGAGLMTACVEPRHVGRSCIGKPDRPGPPLEVKLDEDGELLLRSGNPANRRHRFFSGYYKDEAATEALWRDGWLHTGDNMAMDEEGSLFFLDRKKNIIRRAGENIAAMEVESALLAHPAVGQAAVLAARDEFRGEEVLAVVSPRPGHAAGAALAESIVEHCLERLAYFKAPGYVAFRDALPTTGTQKVRVSELRELAADPLAHPACFDLRSRKQEARVRA